MSRDKKHVPLAWFGTFIVLFSAITAGMFLFAIGSGYNVYFALGVALIVGGVLFSVAFLGWFLIVFDRSLR